MNHQKTITSSLIIVLLISSNILTAQIFDKDLIPTNKRPVEVTFVGHGSLMFLYDQYVIHVDPSRRVADYSTLPKADMILITHDHSDHCDAFVINQISHDETKVIVSEKARQVLRKGMTVYNNQELEIDEIKITAVPAYNIKHLNRNKEPFHAPGEGNGYILNLGGINIYIAGDTENTEEMKALRNIDIAFLPMNTPNTMTPAMVADAVSFFRPKVLYPYHFRGADMKKLVELMKDIPAVELRVRRMY